MKNPFPGMNPYLEQRWQDAHASLVVYIRDAIQVQLPAGLQARVEEDVVIDSAESDAQLIRPDSFVTETREPEPNLSRGTQRATTSTPMIIMLDDPPPPRRVAVYDRESGERVVTAIELLSVTNKVPGEGRQRYRSKQRSYLGGGVNLIEIDLLRQGEHVLRPDLSRISASQRKPYLISVHRAAKPRQFEVYGASLRDRLPIIAVPLRPSDVDIALDIQRLVDEYHDRSGFGGSDYSRPLDPPLADEDAAWAASLLAALPKA